MASRRRRTNPDAMPSWRDSGAKESLIPYSTPVFPAVWCCPPSWHTSQLQLPSLRCAVQWTDSPMNEGPPQNLHPQPRKTQPGIPTGEHKTFVIVRFCMYRIGWARCDGCRVCEFGAGNDTRTHTHRRKAPTPNSEFLWGLLSETERFPVSPGSWAQSEWCSREYQLEAEGKEMQLTA